jgi:hypothetical protein
MEGGRNCRFNYPRAALNPGVKVPMNATPTGRKRLGNLFDPVLVCRCRRVQEERVNSSARVGTVSGITRWQQVLFLGLAAIPIAERLLLYYAATHGWTILAGKFSPKANLASEIEPAA